MKQTCLLAHIVGTLFFWGVSPAAAQVELSPDSPEPVPPDLPVGASGGTHGVVFYDNLVPPKVFLNTARGDEIGDDLHLTRSGNMTSFDFQYIDTGLCGTTLDAVVRFYENDSGDTINPSTGAPLITTVNLTGLLTKVFFTQTVDLTTPVPLPKDVWMTVQLTDTTCVGLVLGDTSPSVGISHDLFWRGAPTDKVLTFGGFPLSNFNFLVRMECATNSECDDGLFCNGAEVCGPLRDCQAGSNPCAAGQPCDETLDVCVVTNTPPVCDAGLPTSSPCTGQKANIQLNGTASSDPDNDPMTFLWTTDCPGGAFDNATSATPILTADSFTVTCNVTLTVTDDSGASDTCSTTVSLSGADISVAAVMHTVASGMRPGSTKDPLAGISVCACDKSAGSCTLVTCGGVSHQHYECIATTCPAVNCCTTNINGVCTINLPPGDYIVISNDATKTVLPDPLGVSASDLVCAELKQKHLQQIVRASGDKVPGKTTRRTGSELLIIEPEFIVWSTTEQLYPFVYEAVGDWSVTTSVSPPTGFVSDYDSLSAQVYNEIEAVQFTITEGGSDLLPTGTTFEVTHKGRREIIHSRVDIFLTPEYARSHGFDVATLRAVGLIRE